MRKYVLLIAAILLLAGCNTRTHQLTTTLKREPDKQPTVVLMPLDVELSLLSAGGLPEVKADWTEAANKLLLESIRNEKQNRNIQMAVFSDGKSDEARNDLANQLIKLHGVVGQSILLHHYMGQPPLPSKAGAFEWSLGSSAKVLKEVYGADYALFVWVRDSYTSGGRAVVMFLAAAAFGVALPGGQQLGFASLVELETGNVVWFNLLARGHGDLRSPEGAANTAENLMAQLPK